jgi:hypothetical protein
MGRLTRIRPLLVSLLLSTAMVLPIAFIPAPRPGHYVSAFRVVALVVVLAIVFRFVGLLLGAVWRAGRSHPPNESTLQWLRAR